MADVQFKGSSDFEKVKKDYESLARHTAKVETENKKLRQESEKVSGSFRKMNAAQTSAITKGLAGIRSMVLQYGSLQAAIALVNKEMEQSKRLSEESRTRSQTAAQAESAVIKNIGDVSDATAQKFIRDVYGISRDAKMPSAIPTLQAASSVLSAVGGDRKTTLDVLRVAAPLFRDKPEEMATFGGALGDVMKVTGGTAKSSAALMLAIQGQARFESLDAFKEVAPALASASVVTRGNRVRNTREAAALFAAIGSRSGDVEGSTTKTAVANLSANLAKAVPELDTTFQRLEKVRSDPKLQEEVLSSGFKGAIKPVIQELLSGADTQTGQMVTDAFGKIVGSESALDRKVRQLTGLTENLRVSTFGNMSEGNIEDFLLTPGAAQEGQVRKILEDTLDKTTKSSHVLFGATQNSLYRQYYDMGLYGGTSAEQAMKILRERRADIAGRWMPEWNTGPLTSSERQNLSEYEQKMVDMINRQLKLLEAMVSNSTSNANRRAQQLERQGASTE